MESINNNLTSYVDNVNVATTSNDITNNFSAWDDSCIKVIYNNIYDGTQFNCNDIVGHTNTLQVSEAEQDKLKHIKSSQTFLKKVRPTVQGLNKGSQNLELKEIGPNCLCPLKCYEKIGIETIQKICRDFWGLIEYNTQNANLFGLINVTDVKRRYTKNKSSRRNFTIGYHIKVKGENIPVCKKAFLNIHGLQRNRGRVNNLVLKMKEGQSVPSPDKRGRHNNRPNAYSDEAIQHCKNQMKLCPKLQNSRGLNECKKMEYSCKKCYELYVNVYCKKINILPISLDKYRRIFSEEGYKHTPSASKKEMDETDNEPTVTTDNLFNKNFML